MIVQFLETKMYIEVLRTILVKLAEMVDYAPLKIFPSFYLKKIKQDKYWKILMAKIDYFFGHPRKAEVTYIYNIIN